MSVKSYLKDQIRLITLSGYDLFTDEENDLYMQIIALGNELDKFYDANAPDEEKTPLLDEKRKKKEELEQLIKQHDGVPRTVRVGAVTYHEKDTDPPAGITWRNLKKTRRIAEFSCELSRAMELKPNEATLDLMVIKWKNLDELHQIVVDGFYMPILHEDGTVEKRKYCLFGASAGQLRRDKVFCIAEEIWAKVKNRIEGGISWEWINSKGGLNINKHMAYVSLVNSATDEWTDFDIDRCIVIPEFESEVTGRMMYIKPDYTYEIGVRTVKLDHSDGCGMILPELSEINFMTRGPFFKGLLCSFDYMRFCSVNNIKPVIKDAWGLEHDLLAENIKIIFTTSQFKVYKLFKSWDQYKTMFKESGGRFCKTNYEEQEIHNTYLNYQMLQTLTDFTDEEVKQLTADEHEKIVGVTKNKDAMLKTLGADKNSESAYKAALSFYPELLREAYSKESLKSIRKRMLLDAKSGKIRCKNKRLFAVPDLYAACQFWFMGIEKPDGLLKDGEIACKIFRRFNKADVLRSPHLYMEHCVRTIVHDQNVYDWFYTNGIVTSCKDLISHVLQMDWDGDQLNVVVEPLLVEIAERNIKKYDVIPLFYDANKAEAEQINRETQFNGLKRAHDYSGIGEVSNMLTKLWNKSNPDRIAAAYLTRYNNDVIDGAKTGKIIHYKDFPKIARKIGRATGGKNAKLPYFFQFSKNGRRESNADKKYAEPNDSTMNRICKAFEDIGNINMNFAGIAQFNWQMLLSEPCTTNRPEIPILFCKMDDGNISNEITSQEQAYVTEWQLTNGMQMTAEDIVRVFEKEYESLEVAYPHIVKYLFAGEGMNRSAHKQMFWRVFGDIALRNLKKNLDDCTICADCGMKIPSWVETHVCSKSIQGCFECIDCGKICDRSNSRQCRCESCQKTHKETQNRARQREFRAKEREKKEERIMRLGLYLKET